MESAFKRVLTNRNPKFEFLLEKKLAFPCQARVSEPRFGQGFPKVPEERYLSGVAKKRDQTELIKSINAKYAVNKTLKEIKERGLNKRDLIY